jgi:hypothetical protein
MDLGLGWEKHIRKRLDTNIRDRADDWDEQDQNPAQGARCQYMIRRQDVTRQLARTEHPHQLINGDRPEVEQDREKDDTNPRITQPAPATFSFFLLESAPRKPAVD